MFVEEFGFEAASIVNFVGGGGKTGLILALCEEVSASAPVVYTTTTRIHPPPLAPGRVLLSCSNLDLLKRITREALARSDSSVRTLVLTRPEFRPGLLRGVPPDFASSIDLSDPPTIFNEADGARSISLKVPRQGEPVLMNGARYLVPVIGLDCLYQPVGPSTIFRWELAVEQFSLEPGEPLTPRLAASLLLHPDGVCRDWTSGMRLVPYINKVDVAEDDQRAEELAEALHERSHFPISKIVWGSLRTHRCGSIQVLP